MPAIPYYDYRICLVRRGTTPVGLLAARVVVQNGAKALRVVELLVHADDVPELGAPL